MGEERRQRLYKIVGAAIAGVSSAYLIAFYANLNVDDSPRPFWFAPTYAATGLVVVGSIVFLVGEFGVPTWVERARSVVRRPKETPTPRVILPEEGEWLALHPMVVDGQLRSTLRHSKSRERHVTLLHYCEVEVEGPDGTFQQARRRRSSFDEARGVYQVEYPGDFGAPSPLKPGRYAIRWYGRGLTGRHTGNKEEDLGRRVLVASAEVVVGPDRWVSRAKPDDTARL